MFHLTFEGTANFTASNVGFFPFMLILDARELCAESFFFFLPLDMVNPSKIRAYFSPKNYSKQIVKKTKNTLHTLKLKGLRF